MINLPDHALARLPLKHGEELLIVLPLEKQPTFVEPATVAFGKDGHSGEGWYFASEEYPEEGSLFRKCPHRPGDVLEVEKRARIEIACTDTNKIRHIPPATYRLTVQRVECKRVRDVTGDELLAAGYRFVQDDMFGDQHTKYIAGHRMELAKQDWDATYVDLGPKFMWAANPWAWLVWAGSGSVKTK